MSYKKNKKNFSTNEKQAYWVGVGMSVATHNETDKLMDTKNTKIRKSLMNGYNADNYKDVSKKFR